MYNEVIIKDPTTPQGSSALLHYLVTHKCQETSDNLKENVLFNEKNNNLMKISWRSSLHLPTNPVW